jgi:hypothetical protein
VVTVPVNMHLTDRFATKEPTACAVCRRRAVWIGYHGGKRSPIVWLCNDSSCHAAAGKVYVMPQSVLDAHETGAALEAGAGAGEYLEEIGVTDLAALNAGQWREFLRRIVIGYEFALRRKILKNEPPF